jgi:hypothetical protein
MSDDPRNIAPIGADVRLVVRYTAYLKRCNCVWSGAIDGCTRRERYGLKGEGVAFFDEVIRMSHESPVEGMERLTRLLCVNDRDHEESCEGNESPR